MTTIWIPKPFTAVEQATGLIQRSLLDSDQPFGLEGVDDNDKVLAQKLWTPWIGMSFEGAHFVEKFSDAIKVGFIAGITSYLKFRWQTSGLPILVGAEVDPTTGVPRPIYKTQRRSFLAIDSVLPWNVWRDPSSRPRENWSGSYLIHGEWKSRAELSRMIKAGWDGEAVARVLRQKGGTNLSESASTMSLEAEAARKQQVSQPSEFRQPYMPFEYWGSILDENGDEVFPDGLMHVVSDELVHGPVENPLWAVDMQSGRRKWPLIAGAPLSHPSRFEGRGLIEQTADLNRLYSGTFCLMADGMNWMVNPEAELWQDALADWTDLSRYPGKLWLKKKSERVLHTADAGKMDVGSILAFLQFLGQLEQNSNFVTDFVVGMPGSRSKITATENTQKTNQSLSIFESMGRNLELPGREAVCLAREFIAQYASEFNDPALVQILGEGNAYMLAQLPPHERFNMLIAGAFNYRFTGVTQALEKDQQVAKIVQWGQLAGSMPYVNMVMAQSPQVFLQVLHVLRDILGLGDKITLPDASAMALPMGAPTMDPRTGQPIVNPATGQPATPNTPADLLGMGGGGMGGAAAANATAAGMASIGV